MLDKTSKIESSKGFSLIELLIVIVITGILSAIAIPNLMTSRRSANEASAVACLRTISNAQITYQFSGGGTGFGTLLQLNSKGLIDSVIGQSPNIKSRYLFQVTLLAATATLPYRYNVVARPQHHTNLDGLLGAGTRDFGTNEAGVIYQTTNATLVTFNSTTRLPTGSAVPFEHY
jgi:prepilin-type N-terminal cleavage/methylation domain-containing protein